MGHSDASALRQVLVDELKSKGHINTGQVEAAFRTVPRHLFVPSTPLEQVYSDQSIPTKRLGDKLISSSSQPAIMAIMLEQLGLEPGHSVLEIGAGTGYNAALISHIVGETGHVVTVDIQHLLNFWREYSSTILGRTNNMIHQNRDIVTLMNRIAHALIISENQRRGKPRGIRPVLD